MMFDFQFSRISFPKASKYLFLIATQSQTKRTDVCNLCTSSPTFQQILQFAQQESYTIKACQATIDRKLRIIGQVKLQKSMLKNKHSDILVFDQDLQFTQLIQGKEIPVGRFHLQIRKNHQLQKSKVSNKNSLASSVQNTPLPSGRQKQPLIKTQAKFSQQIDSDFQMKSDSDGDLEDDCSVKFYIHGGNSFYLGSAFSVQLVWGNKEAQTHYVKDRIMPQWAIGLGLIGNQSNHITLNVLDDKKNILESIKFELSTLRLNYPYHLKLLFREQYFGCHPCIYISLLRLDLPQFSITNKQLQFIISHSQQKMSSSIQYLLLQNQQQLRLPTFITVDLMKYSGFQKVNKQIQKQGGDWKMLLPMQNGRKLLTLLKTVLNQNITLFLINLKDWSNVFSQQNQTQRNKSLNIIEKRYHFQKILKSIYYHNQVHALGKITQIYSEATLEQGKIKDTNIWRTMTKNYILRNNLLNTSIKNIEILKSSISQKGEQLTKLKSILQELKVINVSLKQKQKSTLSSNIKNLKQRINPDSLKIAQIQMMLYQKQSQLSFLKKRNNQMSLRMQSLSFIQQDTRLLNQELTNNSKTIHKQQQKQRLLFMMRKQLPKQRLIISKLQQIFEKNMLDKEMNQLLTKQTYRLQAIRQNKRKQLLGVYQMVKKRNQSGNTLDQKVKLKQNQLVRLNETYAKLIHN